MFDIHNALSQYDLWQLIYFCESHRLRIKRFISKDDDITYFSVPFDYYESKLYPLIVKYTSNHKICDKDKRYLRYISYKLDIALRRCY